MSIADLVTKAIESFANPPTLAISVITEIPCEVLIPILFIDSAYATAALFVKPSEPPVSTKDFDNSF